MGWERRQRGSKTGYYYRSRRVDGKPVKEYVGSGRVAALAARLDEQRREERRAERAAWLEQQLKVAEADLVTQEARALGRLLFEAALLLDGLHNHKGCWRRRRAEPERGSKEGSEGQGQPADS